jgi:hypothetical protein
MLADDGIVHAIPRGHDALAAWSSARVRDLAARIAHDQSFDALPVLGDALEEAGCDDRELLAHCHAGGVHADRCWAVDRITGA